MDKLIPTSSSLLVSLSTYPDFNINNHVNSFYSNFKKIKKSREEVFFNDCHETEEYKNYFQPIAYHLWGYWDLCLITLVDNSEIVTTLIPSELNVDNEIKGQSVSKLHTGNSFEGIGSDISNFLKYDSKKYPFIGLVKLKFSSKWILPNGEKLSKLFFKYLNTQYKNSDYEYFPIHTFTTYDITLIIIGDSLDGICKEIFDIRELKVEDILGEELISENLFSDNLKFDSHLFIDTHSYFGAKLNYTDCEWNLEPSFKLEDDIDAIIEIEAKPGHSKDLEKEFNELKKNFSEDIECELRFQAGHNDFNTKYIENSNFLYTLFNELRSKGDIVKHIRNISTKLLFKRIEQDKHITNKESIFPLKISIDLIKMTGQLKTLKVSKSLRNQIVKLFHTYKNSLKDSVNFGVYLDLYFFVRRLKNEIENLYENTSQLISMRENNNKVVSISEIEKKLNSYIKTFADAYYMRYVNDRSIEHIQDFLIPYNSQIQALVSFYDSFTKCVFGEILEHRFSNDKFLKDSMMLVFDDHITEVSALKIKMLSSNLFEPGLIFNAISKELVTIINRIELGSVIDEGVENLRKDIRKYFNVNPDEYALYSKWFVNFNYGYYITDYIRYKYFFKSNFDLFLFYHLGFALQYSKLYENNGNINNNQLFNEIQRIILLIKVIKEQEGKDYFQNFLDLEIPPEVRFKWNEYVKIIDGFYSSFEKTDKRLHTITNMFGTNIWALEKRLNYSSLLKKESKDVSAYLYNELSYNFMEKVYLQSKKVVTLGRKWNDGEVNLKLLKIKKREKKLPYFLFDSQGGTFFIDFNSIKDYAKNRNIVFEKLRNYSHYYKRNLYNQIQKIENE